MMDPTNLAQFPYPIAFHMARAENPRLPYLNRVNCLLDAHRSLVKFLVLCAVSDYVETRQHDSTVDDLLRRRFLNDKLALGHWVEMLRETVRFFAARSPVSMFVHEMPTMLFKKGTGTAALKRLEALVTFRNSNLAHASSTPGEATAERLYSEQRPLLVQVMDDCRFLCDYTLLIPEEVDFRDGARVVTAAYCCRGVHMPALPTATPPFPTRGEVKRGETLLLARHDDFGQHLLLYPLLIPEYQLDDEAYEIYAYEGSCRATHDRLAIDRLVYHGTRSQRQLDVTRETTWDRAMQSFLQLFSELMDRVLSREPQRSRPQGTDHYFPVQRQVIERYARSFVGRESVFAEVDRLITQNPSGRILIVGPPGQGKTACLAKFVSERSYIHHFFAQDGGRNRHLLAMRSILQQVIERYQLGLGVPEELVEVEKTYAEVWPRVSASRRERGDRQPDVIVLDALDESDLLECPERVQALFPRSIPDGVFFLATSRPGPLLASMQAAEDCRIVPLEPLSRDGVRQMLEAARLPTGPEQVLALWETTRGNPLFLRVQIEEILHLGSSALQHLKLRLEDCFQARIERIMDKLGTEAVLTVVGILAAGRTGLSALELAELVPDVQLYRLRRILSALGEFLLDEGSRFRFFHKRFEEYVCQELFGPRGLVRYHEKIISRHHPWSERRTSYGFRYLSWHLLVAGDVAGIKALVTPEFLRTKWQHEGSEADFLEDATVWLKAGLDAGELLDRLQMLADPSNVLLARKVIRCFADLSAQMERSRLLDRLRVLPVGQDFWIGSEVRKVMARLANPDQRGGGQRLRIGVLNYIGHLPFFLMREAGVFEKAQLDVDLLFFDGHEDRLQAVVARQVEGLATTIDEVLLAAESGLHLQIVLRLSRANEDGKVVDGILVREPISTIKELEGLRIAIEKDSPSLFLLHHVFQTHGVNPSRVRLVYLRSSDDAGAALRDRSIDAAVLWEPWLHRALQDSGCTLAVVPEIDVVEDVLAFRADIMAEYREPIIRLARLWCATVESLESHRELLVRLAKERFGLEGSEYQEVAANLTYAGRQANQEFFRRNQAPSNFLASAESTQQVLRAAGLLCRKQKTEQFVSWEVIEQLWGQKGS